MMRFTLWLLALLAAFGLYIAGLHFAPVVTIAVAVVIDIWVSWQRSTQDKK